MYHACYMNIHAGYSSPLIVHLGGTSGYGEYATKLASIVPTGSKSIVSYLHFQPLLGFNSLKPNNWFKSSFDLNESVMQEPI